MLSVALAGCATTAPSSVMTDADAPSDVEPSASRPVQVSAQPSGVAGQASWLIQPEAPRIPKIAGLESQLPPHIERRLSYAFDLAQRGAVYSAATEFQSVLQLCALELDTRDGGTSRRDALRQGLIALDEADEFSGEPPAGYPTWRKPADVRSIAARHTTSVLKQNADSPVDSIQAAQAYYAYAEERLSYACGELPGSSLAFYGLGRTIAVPDSHITHAAGKAALYHRVALSVAPKNVLAGNELGVILAQHGHLDDAEKLFQQCVATGGSPETYQNLRAVYARKADQQSGQSDVTATQVLPAQDIATTAATSATADVVEKPKPTAQHASAAERHGTIAKFHFIPKLPRLFRK
jgi:hypothetical protein